MKYEILKAENGFVLRVDNDLDRTVVAKRKDEPVEGLCIGSNIAELAERIEKDFILEDEK